MIVYHAYYENNKWHVGSVDASKARSIGGYLAYNGRIYGPSNELFTTEEGARLWIRKEYHLAGMYQVSITQAQAMHEEDASSFHELMAMAAKNKADLYDRLARLDATAPDDTLTRYILADAIHDITRAVTLWRGGFLCYHEALKLIKDAREAMAA